MSKLHVKIGNREIMLEGERSEIEEMLKKLYSKVFSGSEHEQELEEPGDERRASSPPASRKRRQGRQSPIGTEAPEQIDLSQIANAIKESPDYARIETKVIHGNDLFRQTSLICSFASASLTSGEILRALNSLGIRALLPGVSKAIKRNIGSFTQSAARVKGAKVRYQLTSRATKEFQDWLAA